MEQIVQALAPFGIVFSKANIGSGGSATVHACRLTQPFEGLPPKTKIAAKVYHPQMLAMENQIQRVRQEAQIGMKINSPNVVKTYRLLNDDIFEKALSEGTPLSGLPPVILLMEWISGGTLDAWYTKSAPVAWSTVKNLSIDLIHGLTAVHDHGAFHRDVKPENVMIRLETERPSAVLMDIGVATLNNENLTMHTATKDFVGSARYASPQFLMGEEFGISDDVYSLAATLFLLITGEQVYSHIERKTAIPIAVNESPPKIRELASEVPASIGIAIEGALHRDRSRRPSLDELKECFELPETASYISKELDARNKETRGYEIIEFLSPQEFLVDMRGDTPRKSSHFKVIRYTNRPIYVPSYKRNIRAEIFIGTCTLKHIHNSVGHFALQGRWQEEDAGNGKTVEIKDIVVKDE